MTAPALRLVLLLPVVLVVAGFGAAQQTSSDSPESSDGSASSVSPDAPAAALLAADSALGAAAASRDVAAALAAMLADDAVMPDPARAGFAEGRDAVVAAVLRDTLHQRGRIAWEPVRAGVSGDGRHGVTIGLLRLSTAQGETRHFKYLAYWVRGDAGWQARVWRRVPAATPSPGGQTGRAEPWLPQVAPVTLAGDALAHAQHELAGMEQRFSDAAGRQGIGPAFLAFGAADAWHLGSPAEAGFTRGNAAIADAVQGQAPPGTSPVTWSADRALVAGSGDLGVTFGFIVPVAARSDGSRPRFPFFTVWRREAGGWKYIAE